MSLKISNGMLCVSVRVKKKKTCTNYYSTEIIHAQKTFSKLVFKYHNMSGDVLLVHIQWYVLSVTFPFACLGAKLCEVEVFLFSVLQFTEQRLLGVFHWRTKLLMEKIVPCEASSTAWHFAPTHLHTQTHTQRPRHIHEYTQTSRPVFIIRSCSTSLQNWTHYPHVAQDVLSFFETN